MSTVSIVIKTYNEAQRIDAALASVWAARHEVPGHALDIVVADSLSEDGTAQQGGDLGWAAPGQFVPEFEETMNALSLNGISEPFQSRFGLHIVQVLERREVAIEPRQLREQARAQIRERKFEDAYKEWISDLRSKAFIEVREAPLQ